jgi:hypothetical protein
VSFGFLTSAERSFKFAPSCLELMFTNLYSNGVIDSFPVTGVGRVGVVTGALSFFCGVLKTTMGALLLMGDKLIARTARARGGEKLRRRVFVFIAFVFGGVVRTGGGRTLASLTTVTPDAFMKF